MSFLPPMKIFFTFFLICLTVTFACPQTQPILKLDIAKALETPGVCNLSSIAGKVSYVPLEAKPGSFIQNVDRFVISDDFILVADNKVGKVMKFDRTGRYVGDFMVRGNGPKEFNRIDGLDINSKGEILVLKNWSMIDICTKSGDLIKTIPSLVLPDNTAVRVILPDELNHNLDWDFRQRGLVDPATYDIKLYQKLADYGNPVLMMVK